MKVNQYAFTLFESMFSLLLASLLTSALIGSFITFSKSYQKFMQLALLQDNGYFAVALLRRRIHNAIAPIRVIPRSQLSSVLSRRLKALSDVLILKFHSGEVAYYLAKASWKQDGKAVESLFGKPLDGRRRELVPRITRLYFEQKFGGVDFSLFIGKYIWYGFAALDISHVDKSQ